MSGRGRVTLTASSPAWRLRLALVVTLAVNLAWPTASTLRRERTLAGLLREARALRRPHSPACDWPMGLCSCRRDQGGA